MVFDAYSDWQDLYSVNGNNTNGFGIVTINDNAHVSLVDFGLSERFITDEPDNNGKYNHIRFEKINRTLGNKFFMSLNQLKKYGRKYFYSDFFFSKASGRRDDLEQLLYTLVFLAKGDLPWSLKRSYQTEDIIKAKSTPEIIEFLFQDLPSKLQKILSKYYN